MTLEYGITDAGVSVSGSPPSQTLTVQPTVEVFSVKPGDDVLSPTVQLQAGAPPGEGDISISDPFNRVSFSTAEGNYPGSVTTTVFDEPFVGYFDPGNIPSDDYFAFDARDDYNNGNITLADFLAFAYASANDIPISNLPGEVSVPLNVYFTPENFDAAIAQAGNITIQQEGGAFNPDNVTERGCSLSPQQITGTGTTTAEYQIRNNNANTAASVTVELRVSGTPVGSDTRTIQPSTTSTFAFEIDFSAPGSYDIEYDITNVSAV